jgi:plastocyanin
MTVCNHDNVKANGGVNRRRAFAPSSRLRCRAQSEYGHQEAGDKLSFILTTAGEHEYDCSLHPRTIGTIVFDAAAGSESPK